MALFNDDVVDRLRGHVDSEEDDELIMYGLKLEANPMRTMLDTIRYVAVRPIIVVCVGR